MATLGYLRNPSYIVRQRIQIVRDDQEAVEPATHTEPASPRSRRDSAGRRCLVIRRGAIGDYLIAGSVAKGLRAEGYRVVMETDALGAEVLAHNPHIAEFVVGEPPADRATDAYAKVIDLDDSLEHLVLPRHDQKAFHYPKTARAVLFDRNYQELAHLIAGVPFAPGDTFYSTAAERRWARAGRRYMAGNDPLVAWAITGSAIHKIYPWVHVAAARLAARNVHVVLLGGPGKAQELEKGILKCLEEDGANTRLIHPCAGHWTIRESIAFAREADCVIGPETGLMLGVAMTVTPKVIYLSHSSPENLTRDWINTATLTPDPERCPCYPCHRMHRWWDTCRLDEAQQVALCASSLPPDRIFAAVMTALSGDGEHHRN